MWISGICDFLEIWLPGKCFFKENVTSWEVRLPRKCEFLLKYDFPANLTFTGAAEKHGWQGFVNIGLRTFPKIRLPRKCYFTGIVISREVLLPGNCDFPGKMNSIWHLEYWSCLQLRRRSSIWFPYFLTPCQFQIHIISLTSNRIWLTPLPLTSFVKGACNSSVLGVRYTWFLLGTHCLTTSFMTQSSS